MEKIVKTEAEWQAELSPEEYRVCRQQGTERPFTGAYWAMSGKQGTYLCRCCALPLFSSAQKYDSGSGWPSFSAPLDRAHVSEENDGSLGMQRTEVICARCDAHLGHVFPDGPAPSGTRYCINSASLTFSEEGL